MRMSSSLTYGSLFLEGLLSFFSPCVLPLVPLYIGYITQSVKEESTGRRRWKVFWLTLGFILGICSVFAIAAMGANALHVFFTSHTLVFQLAGGILLILSGLVSLHVIRIPFLEKTYMHTGKAEGTLNFFRSYLLGFFFSFAWSPCIGPLLAQAIVLAAQSESGWLYIACYAAGFVIIFLLLGLFTEEVLQLLKKYRGVVKYTGIIAGLVVLWMGGYMLKGAYDTCTKQNMTAANAAVQETQEPEEKSEDSTEQKEEKTYTIDDLDFTLPDADGNLVSLHDYRGKKIIVNFFGTWCQYCNMEMPQMQKVQDLHEAEVILIALPHVNGEGDPAYVEKYMKDAGYSMKILYDNTQRVTYMYGVSGYPSSFYFNSDGTFSGYAPGYVPEDLLKDILSKLS